jgi:Cys-tRNA(Pro)/Cys-tRNA(Cys) deacylase
VRHSAATSQSDNKKLHPEVAYGKTIIMGIGGRALAVVVAAADRVSCEKVSASLGGVESSQYAYLLPPEEAERVSGYKVGTIPPFGHAETTVKLLDARLLPYKDIELGTGVSQ